jgi:ligand-binding sensor domain-containing protein
MSNYIRSLYIDDEGTLWIGTNRGVQYLKPSEKSFYTVPFPASRNAYIQKISQFSDGRIWIAAQGNGIYWIDPKNPDKLNSVVSLNTNVAAGGIFRTMIEDREGIIWLGTPTGVLLYDPKTDNVS